MKIKAFIIIFNRLTWPKQLAENLADLGCEVILLDNHSTYMPLIEWYMKSPFKVHRLEKNYLSSVLWSSGLIRQYPDQYFIVTDCDLDISHIPTDFISVLMNALNNRYVYKAGLSLEINDLPDNEMTRAVIDHEKRFWEGPVDTNGFYRCDVATTFALYDQTKYSGVFLDAIRAPRPYTAKHLPWYLTKETLTEEEKYFTETTQWAGWHKYLK
ncbi:MAG: hypothetical protein PHT07_15290 [Paludibacter sp.]|nr:hypothetical protein [Paludibacter sp.]